MELGVLQEVPVFRPTEKEFSDPLRYIEKIRPEAEQYGLCRVVPPPGFKVVDFVKHLLSGVWAEGSFLRLDGLKAFNGDWLFILIA